MTSAEVYKAREQAEAAFRKEAELRQREDELRQRAEAEVDRLRRELGAFRQEPPKQP